MKHDHPGMRIARCALAAGLASLAWSDAYSQPIDPLAHDAIRLQDARNQHVRGRGKKAWYDMSKVDLSGLPPYVPEQTVSGTIRIWGSNYPKDGNLEEYWDRGFRKYHPDVRFDFQLDGGGTGIMALVAGAADIGINVPLGFENILMFERRYSYDPLELHMASGSYNVPGWSNALGIFVNKSNPIGRLTMGQLDGIFGAQRNGGWVGTVWHPEFARGADKDIRKWGQLGLTGEWADRPIHTYGYSLRYSMAIDFSDDVLQGSDKWNEGIKVYANYVKPDGTLFIEADEVRDAIADDPAGIGYEGFKDDLLDKIKMLAIAPHDGGPYIDLTFDTVYHRTYPLLHQINMYVNRRPGKPIDPKVREFLRYVFSREGQGEVARDGKFLPLTAERDAEQLKKLE
jgi:phosphate transport system substrate-binding protein